MKTAEEKKLALWEFTPEQCKELEILETNIREIREKKVINWDTYLTVTNVDMLVTTLREIVINRVMNLLKQGHTVD